MDVGREQAAHLVNGYPELGPPALCARATGAASVASREWWNVWPRKVPHGQLDALQTRDVDQICSALLAASPGISPPWPPGDLRSCSGYQPG